MKHTLVMLTLCGIGVRIDGLNKGGGGELFVKDFRKD